MRRLLLRRLATLAVTLFFVSLLIFVVVRVLPGDPALIILGTEGNPEAVARLREALGLDRRLLVQYADWLGRAGRGDLGRSIQYDVAVVSLIESRLAITVPLTLMAAALMLVGALTFGVFAATRHRRLGDYVAMALSQVGFAVPSFWLGLMLILVFSVKLQWLRAGGFDGWQDGAWPGIRSLLLPALALALFQFGGLTRAIRSAVLDVMREDYVRTARAKGVREGLILWKHTLRNAMIPVVTIIGIQLGQLMAGSIVLESVFSLPGIGRLVLGAITARDLPVVQGVALFVATVIVVLNAVVDLLYGVLDPRVRRE